MDRQFLINRLQEIERGIANFVAQHHAAQGARQEILNLLANIGESVAEGVAVETLDNAMSEKKEGE